MRALVVTLALLLHALPTVAAASTVMPEPVALLEWAEVSRRPHDTTAFTQGLLLDDSGRLFESTGLRGQSSVREVDPATGEVLRSVALANGLFGEGLALVEDELIGLTLQSGVAQRRDRQTFELLEQHRYEGQGWGLCYDGERLVMSDGSDALTFRDPQTFELLGSQAVTVEGRRLDRLNELECVDGLVFANVWKTDAIVRIDPATGDVTGVLDMRGLMETHPAASDAGAVLNGIAWDASAGTFLLTGKRWPEIIEIRLLEPVA